MSILGEMHLGNNHIAKGEGNSIGILELNNFGLENYLVTFWTDLTTNQQIVQALQETYNTILGVGIY